MNASSRRTTFLLHTLLLQLAQFFGKQQFVRAFSPVPISRPGGIGTRRSHTPSFFALSSKWDSVKYSNNLQNESIRQGIPLISLNGHVHGENSDFVPSAKKKWRKRKMIAASLISFFGGRFLSTPPPAYAVKCNPKNVEPSTEISKNAAVLIGGIIFQLGNRILSTPQPAYATECKPIDFEPPMEIEKGPNFSVAVKGVTGAALVGGIVLQQNKGKKDTATADDKKKQFEEIIGVQFKPTEAEDEKITKSYEVLSVKAEPEEEVLDEEETLEAELEDEKTKAKAAAVTKAISEATEKAKQAKTVESEQEKIDESLPLKNYEDFELEKIEIEKEDKGFDEVIEEEANEVIEEITDDVVDDEVELLTEAEEKQMTLEMISKIEDPSERAFQILLNLGMITISRDPDSSDYDHSDDDEFTT